jgi:hypothetical protein
MQWLFLIVVCLLGGWWLFSALLGGGDQASQAVKASPARGCTGIVVFAVLVFLGLALLGLLVGD